MTIFLHRLLFIVMLFFLGQSAFADEDVPKKNPLPQRNIPVPQIEGYADWKFSDSIKTLQKDARLTFIKAGEEKCALGKEERRARASWPDCFYHATKIFQEPAEIFILVSKEHIERILIHFNRLDSKSASKDCASVINAVVDHLVNKFGIPTKKNDKKRQVLWKSPYGGTLEFRNNCMSEGRGLVLLVISPTPPSPEPENPDS
jgi:hypothetical protein